jgi:hypothetical protein
VTSSSDIILHHFDPSPFSEKIRVILLEIGAKSMPQAKPSADPNDPNGRKPGDVVSIHSDDAWKTDILGEIVPLSAQQIAIRRKDERAGDIVVHFPRAGITVA